eukprot:CAMPEP_0172942278 /NCGR_PEP_ID=MMETSP1075-20121228/224965_1 /TAXON_ID=2916 /ORGANISM="Ceratium fusus, Strain PA161109" /LENGTH=43 /DNA_ID= /DNA_START= /DNA_END= /DNA_ORIENTATION=
MWQPAFAFLTAFRLASTLVRRSHREDACELLADAEVMRFQHLL